MPDADTSVTLRSDELTLTVLPEVGARVHSLDAYGTPVLHAPAEPAGHHADPVASGGYHMLPWCNRLDAWPVEVFDRIVSVRGDHTDGTAIHGLHVATRWEPLGEGRFAVVGGGGGWPWRYSAVVRFALDGPILTVAYALTNTTDGTMPAGLGFHPWFRAPDWVEIPSARVLPNVHYVAEPTHVTPELDLRRSGPVAAGTDTTWVDLAEPTVRAAWGPVRLTMSADDPGAVAAVARPAAGGPVALELQTHAPYGVRRLVDGRPYAIGSLAPGATRRLTVTLAFSRVTHNG